ncbi:unnamed protein product [Ceutorhynchus assimilis]|uniref:Uncharacterized protein n=1 Tax=Ceutorhynchus assimilis TaxID=467358 RepID=A0A9N9QRC8_9CUCU|nr:unnamed protein product [Ceutorhynchus assimilis]
MRYKKKMNCIAACKRKLVFALIIVIFIVFLLLWPHYWIINDIDRKLRLENIDLLIKKEASNLTCKQPVLDIYNPQIMKFVRKVAPIDCSKASIDWVKCTGSECVIQEDAKRKFGPIKCAFTDIIRVNDFELSDGKTTSSSEYYKLEKSDVVRANCQSADRKWSATLTGLRLDNSVWDRSNWEEMNKSALKMNVLMFGYDSLSRNAFIRKLPKTYEYLTKELGAIVLQGYNIIGDGTPQALIPILTGKTELELPDTRKRLRNTHFVNSYPFIWDDYKRAGYVTAFLEDLPSVGTFTYRLNGFKEVPTDHYMRPYYLANLGEQSKWPKLCTGEIPRHQVMLNMIKDFFSMYQTKPKFLFGFHGELSHDDYNLIGAADDDTLDLITELHNSGALNNTVLIVMADHGHRFADVRDTIQGKQEERLPFFSFTFPKWFKQKYPQAYDNFQSNANKLTTPFDIHKTLMDVLHLQNTGVADIVNNRAVSLFSQIPLERSCAHAYIEPHWCTCLDWETVSIEIPVTHLVMRITDTLVNKINQITESHRRICEKLSVKQVHGIMKMSPNKDLLKFSHNADIDGFVADLSANLQVDSDLYQIKATLVPGDSIFEASLRHFRDSDQMVLKISDISRINMYRSQAWCVEKNLPHLGKYCYCKK